MPIPQSPLQQTPDLRTILGRAAVPLFLFSAVLLSLLVLSLLLLLPRFTEVEVAGSVRSLRELREYHGKLTAQLLESEAERDRLILPMGKSAYAAIATHGLESIPIGTVHSALREASQAAVPHGEGLVQFSRLSYNVGRKRIELEGVVRDAGPRSLTVLAQFLEELRDIAFVASLEHAQLTRKEDPNLGIYSPFSVTLHLQ